MYMNASLTTWIRTRAILSPRQSEEYRIQMSLSYDGIGASLQLEDDYVKVNDIIAGGPAQIDGQLKQEDRITAVGEGNGELVDVIGWRLDDVVQKIRGPGGSRVRLQFCRPGAAPARRKKYRARARQDQARRSRRPRRSCSTIPFDGERRTRSA
jgi:carboxyl-terminal processing protease